MMIIRDMFPLQGFDTLQVYYSIFTPGGGSHTVGRLASDMSLLGTCSRVISRENVKFGVLCTLHDILFL